MAVSFTSVAVTLSLLFALVISPLLLAFFDTPVAPLIRAAVPFALPGESRAPIVIVGAGLAGFSAAIEAARLAPDHKVILLEKTNSWGGNSAKASSGINGAGSNAQAQSGIKDNADIFFNDTIKAGSGAGHVELVRALVDDSADAIAFLESVGVPMDRLAGLGGHSSKRTHRPSHVPGTDRPMGAGAAIIHLSAEYARSLPNFEIRMESPISGLIHGRRCYLPSLLHFAATRLHACAPVVTGVRVVPTNGTAPYTLAASAVVLTTGGYAQSPEIMSKHAPQMAHLASTNGPWSSGDGIRFAKAVGADIIQLENVQIHPTAFVDPKDPRSRAKVLAAEALRGVGGILVDDHGRRFTNELKRRMLVTADILDHCGPYAAHDAPAFAPGGRAEGELGLPETDPKVAATATHTPPPHAAYMLMNEEMKEDFGPNFMFYWKVRGFFTRYDNAEHLARAKGFDAAVLRETLERYAAACAAGVDTDFGRPADRMIAVHPDEPIYAAAITPGVHYTMGGIRVDESARVITVDGTPVEGLFAAGEVIGGLHGRDRLGGNSLLDCVVFGRRSAGAAVRYALHGDEGAAHTATEIVQSLFRTAFHAPAAPASTAAFTDVATVIRAEWLAGAQGQLLPEVAPTGALAELSCNDQAVCTAGGYVATDSLLKHYVVAGADEDEYLVRGLLPLCHGDTVAESAALAGALGVVSRAQLLDATGELLDSGAGFATELTFGPAFAGALADVRAQHFNAGIADATTTLAKGLTTRTSIHPYVLRLNGSAGRPGLALEMVYGFNRASGRLAADSLLEQARRGAGETDNGLHALSLYDETAVICGRDGRLISAAVVAPAGEAGSEKVSAFVERAGKAVENTNCSATLVFGEQVVGVLSCRKDTLEGAGIKLF